MNMLPTMPQVAWYGDDFTGSAAVLEVLAFAGVSAVLFLDTPTPDQLARFEGVQAVGIASTARSQSPGWMTEHMPQRIAFLAGLGAPLLHYKICSTLDSSPAIGSIGKAIDVIRGIVDCAWVPFLTAAPPLGRYQAFGNLFATYGDRIHRLDRHPVMARHPVTPMSESDVCRHLSRQTDRKIGLIDIAAIDRGTESLAADLQQCLAEGAEIIALDACSTSHLEPLGRLIWCHAGQGLFAVGSQGIEYALVEHWRAEGLIDPPSVPPNRGLAERMAIVSGSVSPSTSEQIAWALEHGFAGIQFDAASVAGGPAERAGAIADATDAALSSLSDGRDPLVYAARGGDDPAYAAARAAFERGNISIDEGGRRIGEALGHVLSNVARAARLKRLVISGGDTSGYAASQLGIYALTAAAPAVAGAALLDAHSDDPSLQGLEIALKGGQMGTPDYFGWIKRGGGAAESGSGI